MEPKAQFHVIMKATSAFIKDRMEKATSVYLKGFGAFTFQITTDFVKPAQHFGFDPSKDLNEQRMQRKHNHLLRPCILLDEKLKTVLQRYPGKDEI